MPIWLDGGPNERQEKQRIKLAVKKNFREKKSLQARRLRDHNRTASQGQSLPSDAERGNRPGNASQGEPLLITMNESYLPHQQMPS